MNTAPMIEAAITEVNGRFPDWQPTPAMLGYARAVSKAALSSALPMIVEECAKKCDDAARKLDVVIYGSVEAMDQHRFAMGAIRELASAIRAIGRG